MTDEAAVARFEAFVHSQQPAKRWTPVTDYSFEARTAVEGIHPQLIKDVFQPSHALDFGCGFGHLVSLLRAQGVPTKGFDPFLPERHLLPPTARPNCTTALWTLMSQAPFPLVICREVLEHLPVKEVAGTVRALIELSSQYVYVTTRFAKSPAHLLDVDTEFDVDPTHITCLTKPFLRTLFVLEGCKSRPDLEERMDWQNKGRCLVFEVA